MHVLTSYSLVLYNTVFHVTNGLISGTELKHSNADYTQTTNDDAFATEDLTTIFTTSAPGVWFRNVTNILSRCFRR